MLEVQRVWPHVARLLAKGKGDKGKSKGKGNYKGGKGKSKGKDGKGKGGKKGKYSRHDGPQKMIHGMDAWDETTDAWDWSDNNGWDEAGESWWGEAAQQQTAEITPPPQTPYQPEMEAPPLMQGGLWLTGLEMHRENDENAKELMGLEQTSREMVTFGVDSGAAVTVVTKQTASEYPRVACQSKRMTDCQGNDVKDLGAKELQLTTVDGKTNFARVTVAPVAKNLMAVSSLVDSGHEVVFRNNGSYIRHIASGRRQHLERRNGVFEVTYALTPFASRANPPRREA